MAHVPRLKSCASGLSRNSDWTELCHMLLRNALAHRDVKHVGSHRCCGISSRPRALLGFGVSTERSRFYFEACSFDHSDISPCLRIKHLAEPHLVRELLASDGLYHGRLSLVAVEEGYRQSAHGRGSAAPGAAVVPRGWVGGGLEDTPSRRRWDHASLARFLGRLRSRSALDAVNGGGRRPQGPFHPLVSQVSQLGRRRRRYDWLSMGNYEQTLRVDGFRQQELNILNPTYPDPGSSWERASTWCAPSPRNRGNSIWILEVGSCLRHHPVFRPAFCLSSHSLSGWKYSAIALASIWRWPVRASSASGHGFEAPIFIIASIRCPASLLP